MIDGKKAIVGSTNLTYPSISYRWECSILVERPRFVKQIVNHVESIMKESKELTLMDIQELRRIRERIQKTNNRLEKQSKKAEKEWNKYIAEKPPESALILTIDGTQFDQIGRKRRRRFAVIKKAFFPALSQIEILQRVKDRLSNSVPVLFYIRKWTDENSEGGYVVAIGRIPPYGYYKGSLRSLKVFRTRHFGGVPIFAIERGEEDVDDFPRKKRQERAILVIEDFQELPKTVDNYQIERILDSLKDDYKWIGEGMVMGPAGRYIPIIGYEMVIEKAGLH
jgi:hypothetical protein